MNTLVTPELLELLKIDLSSLGVPSIYLCNTQELTYLGTIYTLYPFKTEGYEKSGEGKLPQPTITFSNINGYVTDLLSIYNDFVNIPILRTLVWSDSLTAGDTSTYFVNNYQENEQYVSVVLRSALEVSSRALPFGRLAELLK
jgi:lambda family phage minor tail protein L